MTRLVMIRHGPTDWNLQRRLQGRSDVPLSDAARRWIDGWRAPDDLVAMALVASPLTRAWETAERLFGRPPTTDDRLAETAFGDWEGEVLPDLRERLGAEMAANEARGWHFTPPGGESPAMVLDRLKPFLEARAEAGRDTVAVCHNGIIRVVYAYATGWDMTGKPPEKLRDGCAQRFRLAADGTPRIELLNEPLAPAPFDHG